MPAPPSAIRTNLSVDAPVVQDDNYRFDKNDRAYIDDQIRAVEQHLVQGLIAGIIATNFVVSASSAAIAVGDVLCSAGSTTGIPTVTRATAAAISSATCAIGIALTAASPNGRVLVALDGIIPPAITLLPASSGVARINLTTARCEYAGVDYTSGDIPLGPTDAAGFLTLMRAPTGTVGPPATGPTVTSVDPPVNFALSPVAITVTGADFVNGVGLGVKINGVSCTSVVWVNSTTITCVTPTLTEGHHTVQVTNPDAQSGSAPTAFLALQAFMWFRANVGDYVLDGSSRLSTLTDLSGTGNSLTSQGAGLGPPVQLAAINGRQAFRFTNGTDYMQKTSFTGPSASEVFVVKRSTATGQQGLWTVGSSATQDWNPFGDAAIYDSWGTTVRKSTGTPAGFVAASYTTGHLWNASSAAGAYRASMNGAADYFTTATNTVGWNGTFILGRNSTGIGMNLDFGELVAFPRVLTAPERTIVTNWLKSSWSIP